MEKIYHPYHIVNVSPWPLIVGLRAFGIVIGIIKIFIFCEIDLLFVSLVFVIIISAVWWRDVVRERTFQGYHSRVVLSGLILGIILFIIREIFFFLSFFWGFFHSRLSPRIELGSVWPPYGIYSFNPFQVPLLNTMVLLSSGVTITWCHQLIINNNIMLAKTSLILTWILGVYFLILQGFEYYIASFRISDSVFGSAFFIATGFHGFHVIVGTLFLIIIWIRIICNHFSYSHHFGFEAAAWYWHFVDVVWLFLFSVIYWWGTYYISIMYVWFPIKRRKK